jgi:prepilin-type N-terminal cleavage/methylation domain-containing protein
MGNTKSLKCGIRSAACGAAANLREPCQAARSNCFRTMNERQRQAAGLTLTELLCVMAIILILAALYLPAIAKAYKRIVTFLSGF